ncbi:MAG: sugar transferase [Flavobacteriaceae bacterium]|nr:sugar transferase [Flavobacteriaceae bacterium]
MSYNKIKHFLDSVLALVFILIFIPIIVGVYVLLLLHFKSNPIFVQKRPGYKGTIFHVYKFKTMKDVSKHNIGDISDDQRVTGLGNFLRKLSLDELPQLLNVLRGEMSFVGPRPLLVDYLKIYTAEEMRRHDVRPGITGWAQVNGRNSISWKDKFNLDLWYINNMSFFLDFKILLLTVLKVFKREGVNSSENKIMPHYNGKN